MIAPPPLAGPALRRSVLVAFITPTFMLGIMHGPEGQIQAIYAKHAGVSLTALAAALLISRIFDGITYPLIGWLSDRTYARSGSRKGWVIAGTVLSVLGMWQLMHPPAAVDAVYFGIWLAVIYVGWKVMEIPLQAWSYGLSEDYAERTRVQAWRGLAMIAGTLMFFVIPALAVPLGISDSTELDFRSLGFSALVCAVLLPLATLAAVRFVPDGAAPPPVKTQRRGRAEIWRAVSKNRPLLHLLAAFVPISFLGGLMNGSSYLYVDTYLGLGKQFPAIMVIALVASVVAIPVWSALAKRYERQRVVAAAMAGSGLACMGFTLAVPGILAAPMMFVLYPVATFCLASAVIILAMTADVVDYGRLVTGEDHAGLYGSLFQFVAKSLLGVSAALALALIGVSGFNATAAIQTAAAVLGIKLVSAVIPSLGLIGSAAIIWTYPLTRARVAEIQAQLHQRDTAPPVPSA